jgi:hypothetical protein
LDSLLTKHCAKARHPTEIKFPQQTTGFKNIIEKMYQLYLNRNHDYGSANMAIAGEIGVLIRIWDKFCRLCNLYGIEFPAIGPDIQKLIDEVNSRRIGTTDNIDIIQRLQKLKEKSEFDWENIKPKPPKNEPIEDAWVDMSVYSIIGYLVLQGKWGR